MKRHLPALLLSIALAGCAGTRPSLYAELGGQAGIERAVDAMVVEIEADPRIQDLFAQTDFPYLRARLVEFVCQVADGDCDYTGLPMADAHSGMAITRSEFNWFVEDAERGLIKAGVPVPVQNRLLARLAQLHAEVVGL